MSGPQVTRIGIQEEGSLSYELKEILFIGFRGGLGLFWDSLHLNKSIFSNDCQYGNPLF